MTECRYGTCAERREVAGRDRVPRELTRPDGDKKDKKGESHCATVKCNQLHSVEFTATYIPELKG